MRTRLIAAFAALIAACALVAGPGLVGAQPSSAPASIDPALFRAVTVEPSSEPLVTATPTLDMAYRSAGRFGPDSPLAEFGALPGVVEGRPGPPTPTVAPAAVRKATPRLTASRNVSAWHVDGNVSWYGPGMYGNRTACGVTLTTTVLGVANRTLPCGARVTFRNPANGRTVTVRVIDRGPYVGGRTWDMTGGLCVYLDHCHTGTMEWRLAG